MHYTIEQFAKTLKRARESKGLSQRELSAKSGVPQGHISKIENGAVDLRLTSLVALARILDLELTLVPRKVVSAVHSIVRSSERRIGESSGDSRSARRELKGIQDTIARLSNRDLPKKELERILRQVRDLLRFQFAHDDLDTIKAASRSMKAFEKDTKDIGALHRSLSHLQSARNALAHSAIKSPQIELPRPAYSLDEDDNG